MSLWTEPQYPGDAVRILMLKRGHGKAMELGDVRIQWLSDRAVKVCMFVPGVEECSPGDTPKTWPEFHRLCKFKPEADEVFDEYVKCAYDAGWQNYNPETDGNG